MQSEGVEPPRKFLFYFQFLNLWRLNNGKFLTLKEGLIARWAHICIEAQIEWFISLFFSSSLLPSCHAISLDDRSMNFLYSPRRLFSSCNHKKSLHAFFLLLSLRHRMSCSYKNVNSLENESNERCNSPEPQKKRVERAECVGIKQSKHKFVFLGWHIMGLK